MGSIVIRRRRSCLDCKHRWTTYEITAEEFQRLRSGESKIAQNIVSKFQAYVAAWAYAYGPEADIDGVDRKRGA